MHRQQIRYPYTYTQNNTGGSLTFGFAVRSFSRAFTTYSYDSITIADLNQAFLGPPTITPEDPQYVVPPLGFEPSAPSTPGTGNPFYDDMLLLGSGGRRTVSKITPSFVHNTVDNPIFPSAGRRLTASVDLAGPGGNTRFIKPTLEGVYYRPLTRRMTVGARGQFIYVTAIGDTTILPIFERLFLGGEYSVRGFDIRTIGPRDPLTGYVIGGNTSILFNAEYLIQIAGPVRLVFFYDAGQVLIKQQNPSFDKFKTSTGAEIRFFMPVLNVPFRLIAAWNPQRDGRLRQPVAAAEGVHLQVRRGVDVLGSGRPGPWGHPVVAVVLQRKGTGRMKALTVAVLAGSVLVAGVAYAQQAPPRFSRRLLRPGRSLRRFRPPRPRRRPRRRWCFPRARNTRSSTFSASPRNRPKARRPAAGSRPCGRRRPPSCPRRTRPSRGCRRSSGAPS